MVEKVNVDKATVLSFGDEWSRFDQSNLEEKEQLRLFEAYFRIFPWEALPPNAEGFDMGCGSGRWAKLVLPKVGLLHCIDASQDALAVAQRNIGSHPNVRFHHATTESSPLAAVSQDFGYSLGVLHHIPDTQAAMTACVRLLKQGAPFLVYLYYRFDNRPAWFRAIWRCSEILRRFVSSLPAWAKRAVTDLIAITVYWPLARASLLGERMGINMKNVPLYGYRNLSLYTMRTDSRDRFGTPLEARFTQEEIRDMMERAGLANVIISSDAPYWCAVGTKR
jgi:ubiquinone/menaquinone biosynthesis C-methylase UbiE